MLFRGTCVSTYRNRCYTHGTVVEESTYSFGVFEFDSGPGELRKRGISIRLKEQPCRILRLLIEHQGEVVTREALRTALWPDGTFVE